MRKNLTQTEFLAKAVAAHGVGRYDYSQTVYMAARQKILINCSAHGLFSMTADNHIRGQGCPVCGQIEGRAKRIKGLAEFIERAKAIHGAAYDYSKSVVSKRKTPVIIICSTHGEFLQQPTNHLQGNGCPSCGYKKGIAGKNVLTLNDFLLRAQEINGSRYDYSQVVYKSGKSRVSIGCHKHGQFVQSAANHLQGRGCPKCKIDILKEISRRNWIEKSEGRECILYFLRVFDKTEVFYKVGITSFGVEARYSQKNSLASYQYEILAVHKSYNAASVYEWEQSILETFAHLSYRPQRNFGGQYECFSSCEEILSIFPL